MPHAGIDNGIAGLAVAPGMKARRVIDEGKMIEGVAVGRVTVIGELLDDVGGKIAPAQFAQIWLGNALAHRIGNHMPGGVWGDFAQRQMRGQARGALH